MSKAETNDIKKLSFEEAMAELEAIVRRLDQGSQSLEGSIADYMRGTALKSHCEKKLAEAKLKVEKIVTSASGELKTEPLDVEE